MIEKFLETGSVLDDKRSGRPKTATALGNQIDVLGAIHLNPTVSIRSIARESGISTTSITQILKVNKFHPFKVHILHKLNEDEKSSIL